MTQLDTHPARTAPLLPTTRRGRTTLAALATLAPAAHLAWVLLIPNPPADDLARALDLVAQEPTRFELSMLTQTVFGLVAVVSALVLGAAVRPGSPRLGAVATVVAVVGGSVGWSTAGSATVLAGLERGLPTDQVLELSRSVDAQTSGLLVLATFPLIPVGYLLLGIAGIRAGRRGAAPLWPGVVLTASVPLVMLGGATVRPLFALGWVVLCVGVAGLAASWARGCSPRWAPGGDFTARGNAGPRPAAG